MWHVRASARGLQRRLLSQRVLRATQRDQKCLRHCLDRLTVTQADDRKSTTPQLAAQLARLNGARVIGIAGGERKAAYLKDTLGLDGAVDYKAPSASVAEQLDALCPDGIDFYFDTVGGEILDDVLRRIKRHGRVVVCGASSQYNGNLNVGVVRGPSEYLKLAERGAMMVGYNVMFYLHRLPGAMLHILWLVWRGKLFLTEQVEKGIDAFGPALIKMFTGGHIGKLLVDVKAQEKPTPKAA